MFENHKSPILARKHFIWRMIRHIILGIILIVISLYLGMLGYHILEKMSWVDSFVNAAMILSGMGPLSPLKTNAGKIFAGVYAIYSGLLLISVVAIIAAPIIHRFFHKFLVEYKDFK